MTTVGGGGCTSSRCADRMYFPRFRGILGASSFRTFVTAVASSSGSDRARAGRRSAVPPPSSPPLLLPRTHATLRTRAHMRSGVCVCVPLSLSLGGHLPTRRWSSCLLWNCRNRSTGALAICVPRNASLHALAFPSLVGSCFVFPLRHMRFPCPQILDVHDQAQRGQGAVARELGLPDGHQGIHDLG